MICFKDSYSAEIKFCRISELNSLRKKIHTFYCIYKWEANKRGKKINNAIFRFICSTVTINIKCFFFTHLWLPISILLTYRKKITQCVQFLPYIEVHLLIECIKLPK